MSTTLSNIEKQLGFSTSLSDLDSALSAADVAISISGERIVTIFERKDLSLDEVVDLLSTALLVSTDDERKSVGVRCVGKVTALYQKSAESISTGNLLSKNCHSIRKIFQNKSREEQRQTLNALAALFNLKSELSDLAQAVQKLVKEVS